MRIIFLDTYYPNFLSSLYEEFRELEAAGYQDQLSRLMSECFGTSDFYSRHMNQLGHEAVDIIANCTKLQEAWCNENNEKFSALASHIPYYLQKKTLFRGISKYLGGTISATIKQVKSFRPDILYCQDLWFLSEADFMELRPYAKVIVGQIASPLPPVRYLKCYDLILTSFPHFVPKLRSLGVTSDYFPIGFEETLINKVGIKERDIDISFVGGVSRHHASAIDLLEYLAEETPIQFFGYGSKLLPRSSKIRQKHFGEVWGLGMYQTLSRSKITINRHINVAENYANNMRLYEATGMGALLITDQKDNISELFTPGKEIVTYRDKEDARNKIVYYLEHPHEALQIAKAGQLRTLRDHTYKIRIDELNVILNKFLVTKNL